MFRNSLGFISEPTSSMDSVATTAFILLSLACLGSTIPVCSEDNIVADCHCAARPNQPCFTRLPTGLVTHCPNEEFTFSCPNNSTAIDKPILECADGGTIFSCACADTGADCSSHVALLVTETALPVQVPAAKCGLPDWKLQCGDGEAPKWAFRAPFKARCSANPSVTASCQCEDSGLDCFPATGLPNCSPFSLTLTCPEGSGHPDSLPFLQNLLAGTKEGFTDRVAQLFAV